MRDALSILERCLQEGNNQINEELVKELVGIPKLEYISGITESIINYDVDNALKVVNEVLKQGKDISNLIWEIIKYFKDILVYKTSQTLEIYNEKEITQIKGLANNVSKERLLQIIYDLSGIKEIIKNTKENLDLYYYKVNDKKLDDIREAKYGTVSEFNSKGKVV